MRGDDIAAQSCEFSLFAHFFYLNSARVWGPLTPRPAFGLYTLIQQSICY